MRWSGYTIEMKRVHNQDGVGAGESGIKLRDRVLVQDDLSTGWCWYRMK